MIPEGTRVLLVNSAMRRYAVRVQRQMIEVQGLGVVDGSALCEADFGDAVRVGGKEFVVLRPSVGDLIKMIERRAQVMVPKDSFQMPSLLDIGCGSRVIEGGVGSGALTLVLLHAVGPAGKVVSYENRKDHAALAKRNIALSEHEHCWELRMEDVCTAALEGGADAAVLDIPNPWDALKNVISALRPGGHICCYVPNANQIEAAVNSMRQLGLAEVFAFETIQREMVVHEGGVRPSFDMLGHTGYMAVGRKLRK